MKLLLCDCCSHKMTDVVFSQMGKCPKCCSKKVKELAANSEYARAQERLSNRIETSRKTSTDNKEIYDSWMRFIRNRSR